jgi:cytosine/adenosine deaminase-related metal-dependent hydrolase
MSDVWLKDAKIVTMNNAFDVVEGGLLIRDGKIAAIGEVTAAELAAAQVVDASGQVIIPGFVQTHIHVCQTLMRNCADDLVLIEWLRQRIWPYEASLEFDELRTSADIGLAELLLGGTTTVLDM